MAAFHVTDQRGFGRVGWSSTLVGLGTVALGNMGKHIPTEDARALIRHAWEAGVRLFDTAPMYGHGLAEYRLADDLIDRDRDSYILITKVGRTLRPASPGTFDASPWVRTPHLRMSYDYSYDGVMRQVEDSLQRMATDRFDAVLVHDTDRWTHGTEQPRRFQEAIDGAFPALQSLRDQGVVRALGIGVNETDVCIAAANAVDIDCVLIAGVYNLLDHHAQDELLPLCESRGIAVINARVFGSGILATGTRSGARFNYTPAPEGVVARVRAFEEICDRYQVPLGAVALQFAAAHPVISNVCLGAGNTEQQDQNYRWLELDIPDDLWAELKSASLIEGTVPSDD